MSSMLSCCSKIRSSSWMQTLKLAIRKPCKRSHRVIQTNTFIEIHTVLLQNVTNIIAVQFHLFKVLLFSARILMSSGHDPEPRSGPNCTASIWTDVVEVSERVQVCDSGPLQSPQFQAQHLQGGVRLHDTWSQVKLIYLALRTSFMIVL